jgi:ABC-type antimicrobial peptide transport system permease subunit
VNNFAAIDATPAVLAAVLGVLGLGVLGQFTISATQRRRRDFAVLKVLGVCRPQLTAVTCWQASVVAAAALALGIPAGIAGGRAAWLLFADQAGLSGQVMLPLLVVWMIPATLGAALLVAWLPARSVARLAPGTILHAE